MRNIFILFTIIALSAPLLAGRNHRAITPYQDIIAESDLIVVGQVLAGQLSDLTQTRPALPRKPKAQKNAYGQDISPVPSSFSWRRADLQNPEELHTFQVRLQILHDPTGALPEGRTVRVNLGYGMTLEQLENFLETHYAKSWCEPDSFAVFHLKQVQYPNNERAEYELVVMPWVIDRADVDRKKDELDIRWARFKAYQRIETLMSTWRDNKQADFDEIIDLLYSEPEAMGEPVWLPGEREGIDRLDQRTKSGAATENEWRQWWSAHKIFFVDAPFRQIAGN